MKFRLMKNNVCNANSAKSVENSTKIHDSVDKCRKFTQKKT